MVIHFALAFFKKQPFGNVKRDSGWRKTEKIVPEARKIMRTRREILRTSHRGRGVPSGCSAAHNINIRKPPLIYGSLHINIRNVSASAGRAHPPGRQARPHAPPGSRPARNRPPQTGANRRRGRPAHAGACAQRSTDAIPSTSISHSGRQTRASTTRAGNCGKLLRR